MKNMKTRDMALTALFAALISVGGRITIPIPYVPITLQTLFTVLAGLLLGSKLGAVSSALYVLMGLLGLPVFSAGAGPAYVFHPTFGYMLGFIVGAWLAGYIVERAEKKDFKTMLLACLANGAVVYAIGLPYYYLMMNYYVKSPIGAQALLLHGFLMTLPGDFIKYTAASLIAVRMYPILKKQTN